MPVHYALEEILMVFKEADKARGLTTILYDDPETTIMAESDVLKELNQRLRDNPDYVLPEVFLFEKEEKKYTLIITYFIFFLVFFLGI